MKIAIAGYGVEGKASFEYWRKQGAQMAIVDEREVVDDLLAGVEMILGADAFSRLADFDLIVRSPSVHVDKLPYGEAVWSATNEFFARCPAPIIGVTGTKGKGTTSSLIASILEAAGKTVHLVGNIGQPAIEALPGIQPDDIVVYELSSFQLWDLQRSPHIAVVLPIEPDHLDVHTDFDEYIAAKANITAHQTDGDVIVYNKNNDIATAIAMGGIPPDRHPGLDPESSGHAAAVKKIAYPFDISDVADSLQLLGAHNIENAAAAIAAVREYVTDADTIRRGLASFTGLPHRLKFVAEVDGVKYYDDSIATTSSSAIAALHAFAQPKIIILGGHDKGGDTRSIIELCRDTDTRVIAIGRNARCLEQLCAEYGVPMVREAGDMGAVVAAARDLASPGDVVILSPAHASFDQYASYADRGDQFIAAVEAL